MVNEDCDVHCTADRFGRYQLTAATAVGHVQQAKSEAERLLQQALLVLLHPLASSPPPLNRLDVEVVPSPTLA